MDNGRKEMIEIRREKTDTRRRRSMRLGPRKKKGAKLLRNVLARVKITKRGKVAYLLFGYKN